MELVPNFPAINWWRSDHEILDWVEVSLISVCEVRVIFKKVFEFMRLRFKLSIFVLEHSNSSSSMNDQYPTLVLVSDDSFIFFAGMYLFVKTYFPNKLFVNLSLIHFALYCLFINFIYSLVLIIKLLISFDILTKLININEIRKILFSNK